MNNERATNDRAAIAILWVLLIAFLICILYLLLIISSFSLIKMLIIWIFLFFISLLLYKLLKMSERVVNETRPWRNFIHDHRTKICIFLLGLVLTTIFYSFFLISREEKNYLEIDISGPYDTELRCEKVYEFYDKDHPHFGYIRFNVCLKIEGGHENFYEIRVIVKRNRDYFHESFEKSYIEGSDLETKKPSRCGDGGNYFYYFDIPVPSQYKEIYFYMYIYVGDVISTKKERVYLDREITMSFDKNATIISNFGTEWDSIYTEIDKGLIIIKESPYILKSKVLGEYSRREIRQYIILERAEKISIREARIGLFLSILLAGISLIITLYLHERGR